MDNYFFEIAKAVSTKSKDPNTKVGCVIVNGDNKIVSTGYNGMVKGCAEALLWTDKHKFVIHAEMNAALFSRLPDLRGCQVYLTHAPCINCLKHLMQLGVRVIFYLEAQTKTPLSPSEKSDLKLLLDSLNGQMLVKNKNHKTYMEELWDQEAMKQSKTCDTPQSSPIKSTTPSTTAAKTTPTKRSRSSKHGS